jgi:hypothetical protein
MKPVIIIVLSAVIIFSVLLQNLRAAADGQAFSRQTKKVFITRETLRMEWKEWKCFANGVTPISDMFLMMARNLRDCGIV